MKSKEEVLISPGKAIGELGLDDFEHGLLIVLRYIFRPEGADCTPYLIAVERWGEEVGLPVAYRLINLAAALNHCKSDLKFKDPLCLDQRVSATRDEVLVLLMLHHMRRDQTSAARHCIEELTGGRMDPHLIRIGLSFAFRFSCGAQGPRKLAQSPKLYVV